jgi:hypothetical protein
MVTISAWVNLGSLAFWGLLSHVEYLPLCFDMQILAGVGTSSHMTNAILEVGTSCHMSTSEQNFGLKKKFPTIQTYGMCTTHRDDVTTHLVYADSC